MKRILRWLLLGVALVALTACGGGSSSSESIETDQTVDTNIENNTYELSDGANYALMGPLKNATVKAYRYLDTESVIEESNTGNMGEFNLSLSDISNDDLILITVFGGSDVDVDDDGVLDDSPVENKGIIHAWARASDIKNGRVNVTLLSEIVYQYTKHLIGQVSSEDFVQALDVISKNLFEDDENYVDLLGFKPYVEEHKNRLNFNYASLLQENSLAELIRRDENVSELTKSLDKLFSPKLAFNSEKLIRDRKFYKLTLVRGIESNASAVGSSIFYDSETNSSNLIDFVAKDSNISVTVSLADSVKIVGWNGCDKVSSDGMTCSIQSISSDRVVSPSIIYKESILRSNVKDVSDYFVTQNDNNFTVSLDLNYTDEQKQYIESIEPGDIIASDSLTLKFAGKVISKTKVDDYNYIFETEEASIFEIFEQAGISFNRYLTHEDLVDTTTLNRSLATRGLQLLPPRYKGDNVFTIAPIESINRADSVAATWDIWESEDGLNKVSAEGKISFKLKPIADINTRFFSIKSVKLAYEIENVGELKLITTGTFDIDSSKKISELNFKIAVPYVVMDINVPIFAGAEGSIKTALSVGVGWNTVETIGMNYVDGSTSVISESSRNYYMLGEIPGTNVEFEAGAFLKPVPSIVFYKLLGLGVEVKAGPYFTAKTGIELNNGFNAAAGARLDIKLGLKPKVTSGSLLPSSFEEYVTKINDRFLNNIGLSFVWNLWKQEVPTQQKPSFLKLVGEPIRETIYSDESFIKNYVYQIRNIGDKDLNWKIVKEGYAAEWLLEVSKDSGTIEPGGTEEIIVSISIDDTNPYIGDRWEGLLKFINNDDVENYMQIDTVFDFQGRLPKPDTAVFAEISGYSMHKLLISGFNTYNWPEFAEYGVRGFKFYLSEYNDNTGECNSTDMRLLTAIDNFENESLIENDQVELNFDEMVQLYGIEGGKRYCIAHNAFYENSVSEQSDRIFALYVPKYGSIKTSIKDRNGNPVEARVYLTALNNASIADGDGNVVFENLMPGTYLITVDAEGFINTPSLITVEEGEEVLFEGIRVIEEELEGVTGTLTGKLVDAVSGNGIEGATIEIREGNSNTTGDIINTIQTDANGVYSVELLSGNYTLTIKKSGYAVTYLNALSIGNQTTTQDLSISPLLNNGEMRIVLRWGETPSDLDSHLVRKTNGIEDYHVYYSNMTGADASLDIDDVTSYGPETITINSVANDSVYTYYVYNYSHNNPQELKNSSATVEIIYNGQTIVRAVPNEDGYYWKVFEVVNGEIVLCNQGCVQDDTSTLIRSLNSDNIFANLPLK